MYVADVSLGPKEVIMVLSILTGDVGRSGVEVCKHFFLQRILDVMNLGHKGGVEGRA